MPTQNAALAADMLVWADPVIRDRIRFFWERALPAVAIDAARALTDAHWRMWRCALSGLPHAVTAGRRDLFSLAESAGLPAGIVASGDEAVIDEFADLIVTRCRRSPHFARDYTRVLVMIAASVLARDALKAA